MKHLRAARFVASAAILALVTHTGACVSSGPTSRGLRTGDGSDAQPRSTRGDAAPKVGDLAPTFTLKSSDGKRETSLASFRGKRPVILFFGSYT